MDIQDIKIQTRELCAQLDEWGQQLIEGSLAIADVRRDFEERYQPKALALTDSMTAIVSPGTPGITIEFSDGTTRRVTFSDRQSIASPLPNNSTDAHVAGVQFKTMASILRRLATSLPEPTTM
jgi:hypothetical protein